jgi:hypothetical protein
MKLSVFSLSLAIIGTILTYSFDAGVALLKFNFPENVILFFGELMLPGLGLSFLAFFLSCYATLKGVISKSGRQILLGALGIVVCLSVVLPAILAMILGYHMAGGVR